jgi:hypothetical protein
MATFLLQLLRAGSRPLPRKAGSMPRRAPAPVASPDTSRSLAESQPDAASPRPRTSSVQDSKAVAEKPIESVAPVHSAPVPMEEPSLPPPQVQPPVTLTSPEVQSRPDNRITQERGTNSTASPESLAKREISASELPKNPASPPKQAHANQPDWGMEESAEHPPRLPVAQVESTHWQMPREMEARFTGRRDFSSPQPPSSRKVPYVEFVAKGNVVSTLGPPPDAVPPTLRQENRRLGPRTDTVPASSKQKPQPQLTMETAPGIATRVDTHETESLEKPATRIQAPGIIRSAVTPDIPPRATLGRSAENQGSNWHARRDDTRAGQPASKVDNSVNIKRIDIQILNEEPRNHNRQRQLAAPEESISARLDRHYIREVV